MYKNEYSITTKDPQVSFLLPVVCLIT